MGIITKAERDVLYEEVRYSLGYGITDLEVDDKAIDVHLGMSIKDYSSFINNWLIEQQWGTLQSLDVNTANLTFALTTKTTDFESSFSVAYGKQTGVGTLSPWELKKDYVVVSAETQVYTIPKDREVNEVLWYTPPMIDRATMDTGANVWQGGAQGWTYGGVHAQAIMPTYSIMMYAQDRLQRRKLLQSELTYRIVGGPNGTKQLFLYPIPGSKLEISGWGNRHDVGSKIWYFYYDTNSLGRDKCLEENEDIVKLPNDVEIKSLKYGDLNTVSESRVRRLLVARLKNYLAINRGKFSGDLKAPDSKDLKLDYSFFLDQAQREEEKLFDEIKDSLSKLTHRQIMEDKEAIANSLNNINSKRPPRQGFYVT